MSTAITNLALGDAATTVFAAEVCCGGWKNVLRHLIYFVQLILKHFNAIVVQTSRLGGDLFSMNQIHCPSVQSCINFTPSYCIDDGRVGPLCSRLQHIPKTANYVKVWTLWWPICENHVSCSLNHYFTIWAPMNTEIVILEYAHTIREGKKKKKNQLME